MSIRTFGQVLLILQFSLYEIIGTIIVQNKPEYADVRQETTPSTYILVETSIPCETCAT